MQSLFTMLTFFYSGLELDLSHTLLHRTRRERACLSLSMITHFQNQQLPPLFWQLLALLCSDFYQIQRLKDTFQLLEINFSNRETLSTVRQAKQRAGAQASISGFLVQRHSMNPSAVLPAPTTLEVCTLLSHQYKSTAQEVSGWGPHTSHLPITKQCFTFTFHGFCCERPSLKITYVALTSSDRGFRFWNSCKTALLTPNINFFPRQRWHP